MLSEHATLPCTPKCAIEYLMKLGIALKLLPLPFSRNKVTNMLWLLGAR